MFSIVPYHKYVEQIKKSDKEIVANLHYKGIEFSVSKKVIIRLKQKLIYVLMYSDMKMNLHIQFIF